MKCRFTDQALLLEGCSGFVSVRGGDDYSSRYHAHLPMSSHKHGHDSFMGFRSVYVINATRTINNDHEVYDGA
jgi:hypothetical protein